jgi:hypothetical protein
MVRVHPGPPAAEGGEMGEEKKGGKLRKLFLFTALAGLVGAVVTFFRRRRAQSEESEWQELPPPES